MAFATAGGAVAGATALEPSITATWSGDVCVTWATDVALAFRSAFADGGSNDPLVPAEAAGIDAMSRWFGLRTGAGRVGAAAWRSFALIRCGGRALCGVSAATTAPST